jgi:hypothetical protein
MGQIEVLAEAITSLRITSCYEGYHGNKDSLRQETIRRHEAANREQILRDRDSFRRERQRLHEEDEPTPGGSHGPMTTPEYRVGREDSDGNRLNPLSGRSHMTDNQFLEEMLMPHALQRWKDLRAENETVFTNIWTFRMTDHKLIGPHYDIVAEYIFAKEQFVTGIADSLARFSKLQRVEFLEAPIEGAKRYEALFQIPRPTDSRGEEA